MPGKSADDYMRETLPGKSDDDYLGDPLPRKCTDDCLIETTNKEKDEILRSLW